MWEEARKCEGPCFLSIRLFSTPAPEVTHTDTRGKGSREHRERGHFQKRQKDDNGFFS